MRITLPIILALSTLLVSNVALAQTVGVASSASTFDSKSILDVQSTSKGVLMPRMTAAQQDAMDNTFGTGQAGMVVYITDSNEYQYWDGTQWIVLLGSVDASNGLSVNNGGAVPDVELGGDLEYDTQVRSGSYDMRFIVNNSAGGGRVAIGSTALTIDDTYSLTVERPLDNNIVKIGGADFGINLSVDASSESGLFANHSLATTSSSAYYAVGGRVNYPVLGTGYLGYHTSGDISYAVYGTGGTFSGYFQGKTVITSATNSSSVADLEVQNITTGAGNAATLSLRQTTSNSTNNNVLGQLNFGDNYGTGAQAQIQVIRGAAGGASDWPTSMIFSNTPDASTTLTERMRIIPTGNIGIGVSAPTNKLEVNGASTVTAIRGYYDSNHYGYIGSSTLGGYFHGGVASSTESFAQLARNNYEGIYAFAYNDDAVEGHTASSSYYGVYGANDAASGTGVYGYGGTYGTYGYTPSTTNGTYGVYGSWSSSRYGYLGGKTGSGYFVGAYGSVAGSGDFGVIGANSNASGTGVVGGGNGLGTFSYLVAGSGGAFTGQTVGMAAFSTQTGTTANAGVYAYCNSFARGAYLSFYNGTFYKTIATGAATNSCSVPDLDGNMVVMHAPETPEAYFQDFGQARLVNGRAHIDLDPIFAKNVTINEKHPLRVFIQLEDNESCRGVVVKNKTTTGFDVVELGGGTSDTPFQYTVTCNMADSYGENGLISKFADLRFEPAPPALMMNGAEAEKVEGTDQKWKTDPMEGKRPVKR
jgi:hypothetical protein